MSQTITQRYLERGAGGLLLRLATSGPAVIDVFTDDATLRGGRDFLAGPTQHVMRSFRLGTFGPFEVSLCIHPDEDTVSIAVNGPHLGPAFRGDQGFGIYLSKTSAIEALSAEV